MRPDLLRFVNVSSLRSRALAIHSSIRSVTIKNVLTQRILADDLSTIATFSEFSANLLMRVGT